MKIFFWILVFAGIGMGTPLAAPVDLNYQMGLNCLRKSQFQESLGYLKKALKKDRKNPKIQEMMGECYQGLHQDDKALAAYQKCLALDPANLEVAKQLNDLQVQKQNPEVSNGKKEAPVRDGRIEFGLTFGFPSWPGPSLVGYPWVGGQGFDGWLGYGLNQRISVGLRVSYFWYLPKRSDFANYFLPSATSNSFTTYNLDTGGEMDVVQFVPTVKLNFDLDTHELAPYVFTGLGLMNESMKSTNVMAGIGSNVSSIGIVPGFSRSYTIGVVGLGLPFPVAKDIEVTPEFEKIFGFSDNLPISYDNFGLGVLFRM
ncbi:MAG TPA: tetratricopeptide repeat protein [bacterium]|nr:tetratricopeptide repeat protein [bacterium]